MAGYDARMDGDELIVLEGEELAALGPLQEESVGGVHVPKKGSVIAEDGTVQIAVIRPCQSRGKRLRGLAPVYEASMLGRNASVFSGWHMWMGHISEGLREAIEEIEEKLEERGAATNRNIARDLGGRIVETWFDPDYVTAADEENGYRRGAVMAKAIPYPAAKAILECDPQGLAVSIACWPTAAREGAPSWDPKGKGMIIEGFRSQPVGSVDWVLRPGAGGGVVREAEERAVSILVSHYDAVHEAVTDLKEPLMGRLAELKADATPEQVREALAADHPELAEKLDATPPESVIVPTMSEQEIAEQAAEAEARIQFTLQEQMESFLEERRQLDELAGLAETQIDAAGLGKKMTANLKGRYAASSVVLESLEATEDKSVEEVLREAVEADITEIQELLAEAQGKPVVAGLGGETVTEGDDGEGEDKKSKPTGAFRTFVSESVGKDLSDEEFKTIVEEAI